MLRPSIPLLALLVLAAVPAAAQQRQRPYSEGQVEIVSYVRTKPGMFEKYLKYLQGPYKQLLEEQKKAGIVVNYGVFSSDPRNPQDWDLLLTVTYKNMAALDGLQDKTDPIVEKIFGNPDQQDRATISREEMREILGSRQLRELVLK